jgi:hypothetical protein
VPHTQRKSDAAHHEACLRQALLHAGYDARTIRDLLGHAEVTITMTCMHVLKVGNGAVRRPVDSRDLAYACRRRTTEHTEADRREWQEVAGGRCLRSADSEGRLKSTLLTFALPGSTAHNGSAAPVQLIELLM